MTQRVLRWDVPVDDQWHEIGGGRVVHVAARAHRKRPGDLVEVWTLEGAHPRRRERMRRQAEALRQNVAAGRVYVTPPPLPELVHMERGQRS